MFITIRISLQPNTTEEHAKKLGNYIARHMKDSVGQYNAKPIDKVYLSVGEDGGNCLRP